LKLSIRFNAVSYILGCITDYYLALGVKYLGK
jgi:radial spoke head protein 9